jgi:hypothetical protein
MKLNPPASSSDLEVARKLARRLHQRARGAEPTPDPAPAEARPPSTEGRPPSLTSRAPSAAPAAPPERELDLRPEPPELSAPEAPLLEPEPPELESMEPEPPVLEPEAPELEPEPPELEPMPPGGYTADTGSFPPSAPEEPELQPPPFEPEPPGGYTTDTPFEPEPPVPPEPVEPEEPSLGDADVGPSDTDDAFSRLTAPPEEPTLEGLEAPSGAGVSPEDLIPEEPAPGPGWSEPSPIEAELAAPGEEPATTAEDLVEVSAPSWDDVADSCLALAPANGAMLVDPAGQVLAARGDWPEPGPEAIAGRLVSMMEKKLRDAPTRSVSAPLAGQHLTAWRVPADDGYLTIVFMAPTPLRADVRPSIDAAIQASAG